MTTFVPLVTTVSSRPMEHSSALSSSSCSPVCCPSPIMSVVPQTDVGSDCDPQSSSSLPSADADTPSSVMPTSSDQSIPPVQDQSIPLVQDSYLPLTNTDSMVSKFSSGLASREDE
ncbi:hypothetical protein GOBAR_AA17992 [Gossypium barbadense]|uniref:Uncharacterized protein n=1 Tax=Gossypium barbadense TaxID=3634 RepID=A0A2P5XH64_GOSBA|nr:hypothetical protein GOBAR_AA17992 [Gossypium barbadense]